jgi:hypothetical protein
MLVENPSRSSTDVHDSRRVRVGGDDGSVDVVGKEVAFSDKELQYPTLSTMLEEKRRKKKKRTLASSKRSAAVNCKNSP